ncbi:hypothetical protein BD779DRAFT_1457360 [Infundibulicybe gibba]|nr:hypothetical protein BD779DRAFT_1457360 [Infundibulicybe gibba]
MANSLRSVPQLKKGQEAAFQILWAKNLPLVFGDIWLKGDWTPTGFTQTHGGKKIFVYDSRYTSPKEMTVENFFLEFNKDESLRTWAIKTKDWPPSTGFREYFKSYFGAFMDGVPMPAYTRHDGWKNLAAHFPIDEAPHRTFKPDLGPKMYVATKDHTQAGSTRLHMDVTSAVNILVYDSKYGTPTNDEGGATWHIFRPEDSGAICNYIRSKFPNADSPNPIHAQETYLDKGMIEELLSLGVRPFRIHQRCGDAVFIPAGAAHQAILLIICQVSNLSSCIKIACDFLCLEGIPACSQVTNELRILAREDILQLRAMLYYAWCSINRLLGQASQLGEATELSRKEKKRKDHRHSLAGQTSNAQRKRQKREDTTPIQGDFEFPCPHPGCLPGSDTKARLFKSDGLFNHM